MACFKENADHVLLVIHLIVILQFLSITIIHANTILAPIKLLAQLVAQQVLAAKGHL